MGLCLGLGRHTCPPAHAPAPGRYPTGPECQRYLERYAAEAGLRPLIKFGVTVTALKVGLLLAGMVAGRLR